MTTNEPDQSNSEVISRDPVSLPLVVTVGDLAEILQESQVDVVKALMKLGVMASVNEEVDFSTAARVAQSFEIPVLKPKESVDNKNALNVGSSIDTSFPSNTIDPESFSCMPDKILINVDFPAPLSPNSPNTSELFNVTDTSLSAITFPKLFEIFFISIVIYTTL